MICECGGVLQPAQPTKRDDEDQDATMALYNSRLSP